MIQRIQTLYLLAVAALGITLLFMPVVQLISPEGAAELQVFELSALGGAPLKGLWGLTLATALIPLLALIDIFLYKKRILQARLNIFTVMLCLGYYGVLAIYIWLAKMSMGLEWHLIPWASIPLVCMILTLMATRAILKDEALVRAAAEAHEGLSGEQGVCDLISDASSVLRDAASYDERLDHFAELLESALLDVEDVASELRRYQDSVDLDQEALAEMQARFSAYQGLLRSFGPYVSDVLARRAQAAELVSAARDGGALERKAQRRLDEAEAALAQAAEALEATRAAAAPELSAAISREMAFLEMGSAEVAFAIEQLPRRQWGLAGPSKVELMYRPAAGLTARPLKRIASGGEVSRVMLATKVVLGERAGAAGTGAETLVFDEVDAGVGGATALALAQVLARLAKTHQVIVVTHLAQVAVVAERHYLVAKSAGEGSVPETTLSEIAGDERVAEIARMLSGFATEASLAHARELLDR